MATPRKRKGDEGQSEEFCSLPNCNQPSAGHGSHLDGPLCSAHLKRDADRFRESYYSYRQLNIDGAMRRVSEHMDLTRGAIFELTSDRANASEMFDEILDIVHRCRDAVIGRLDSKIDEMDATLKSLHFFEKLRADINESETAGDLVKSFQLTKKMQLALEDAPIPEAWTDPVDGSVELVQKLLQGVKTQAAVAEDGDGFVMKSGIETSVPTGKFQLLNHIQFVLHCDRTEGYFYNANSVAKAYQNGFQSLPSSCIIAIGNNGANWFVAFYTDELAVLSQRNIPSNGVVLVSAALLNHLQQIFLLGSNKSLTVTDLAGTQLRTVANVEFVAASPRIAYDMEKLYILADRCVNYLSLESFELQDSAKLPEKAKRVCGMTLSGRSLILATNSAVFRLSIGTKRCVKLWQSNSSNLVCVVNISSGCVAACDSGGKVTVLSSSRRVIRVIDLVPLGINSFKTCQNCGVSYVCQSISSCGSSRDSVCSFLLLMSLSCGHRLLARVTMS